MASELDVSEVLERERDALPGSFIARLRFDLQWDSAKFADLCGALHAVTKVYAENTELPRGLSQLFWYCGTFIPRWIEQREFCVGQPGIDYEKACALLKRLGDAWFGDDCLLSDCEFAKKLRAIKDFSQAI